MGNITAKHPHVQITTTDLTRATAEATQNGTGLFAVSRFAKGLDGKIQKITSPNQYINEYGVPDYKAYGQAPLNVANWLNNKGVAYVLRVLPQNATYAHTIVSAQTKIDNVKFKRSVRLTAGCTEGGYNIKNEDVPSWKSDEYKKCIEDQLLDKSITLSGYNYQYDLMSITSLARGEYYNSYCFRLAYDQERSKNSEYAIYDLTFYQRSKTDAYTLVGSFMGSMLSTAKSSSGTSLFLEDVVKDNSDMFRVHIDSENVSKFLLNIPAAQSNSDILFGTDLDGKTLEGWEYDYATANEIDGMDLLAYSTVRKNIQDEYDSMFNILNKGIELAYAGNTPHIEITTGKMHVVSATDEKVDRAVWTLDPTSLDFVNRGSVGTSETGAKAFNKLFGLADYSTYKMTPVNQTGEATIIIERPMFACSNVMQKLCNIGAAVNASYLIRSISNRAVTDKEKSDDKDAYTKIMSNYSSTLVSMTKINNRRDTFILMVKDICNELEIRSNQLSKYNGNETALRDSISKFLEAKLKELSDILIKDLDNKDAPGTNNGSTAVTGKEIYFANAYKTINKVKDTGLNNTTYAGTDGILQRAKELLALNPGKTTTPTIRTTVDTIKGYLGDGDANSTFTINTSSTAGTYATAYNLMYAINQDAATLAINLLASDTAGGNNSFAYNYPSSVNASNALTTGNYYKLNYTEGQFTTLVIDAIKAASTSPLPIYDWLTRYKKQYVDMLRVEISNYSIYTLMTSAVRISLGNGSDGSVITANKLDTSAWDGLMIDGFNGTIDPDIKNFKEINCDVILDANYGYNVKMAIVDLIKNFRNDIFFYCDNGIDIGSTSAIMAATTSKGYPLGDVYDVSFDSQAWDVTDPYTLNGIRVTTPYMIASMLPNADSMYGIHQALAGTTRGRIENTQYKRLSFTPNFDEREMLYLAKVNYAERDPRYTKIATQITTLASRDTALCDTNNVRVVKRIRKDITLICEDFLQELSDSSTLRKIDNAIRDYLYAWKENRCCTYVNCSVSATEYERAAGIVNVAIELKFTGVIKIINVDLVIQ